MNNSKFSYHNKSDFLKNKQIKIKKQKSKSQIIKVSKGKEAITES